MTQRKLARKTVRSEPHLKLVQKPKRRRKRWKVGRSIFKPKYVPELLLYEEGIVLGAIQEMGGRVSVKRLIERWPGRFSRKPLWWALLRLAEAQLIKTAPGLGLIFHRRRQTGAFGFFTGAGPKVRAWYERHHVDERREFWL